MVSYHEGESNAKNNCEQDVSDKNGGWSFTIRKAITCIVYLKQNTLYEM